MKFSLSWLKDHLETTASVEEIVDHLTWIGIEVDGVEDKSALYKHFITTEILEIYPHPDADKLKLCKIATGDGDLQVVCGDPAVSVGMKTIFAPIGATIPATGTVLKKTKIRGIESPGMLCSEQDLGFAEQSNGVVSLPKDVKIGESIIAMYGLDDPVFDVAIVANRPDWLGVRGIARELATRGAGTLKPLRYQGNVAQHFKAPINISLDFSEDNSNACPFFAGRLIKGVRNGPSPEWLQKYLTSIGLRPISLLVDITNYFTFDQCRPLHVFDADKITGNLVVTLSKGGETLAALDNKTYTLEPGMTVIADDSGVLSLGGVVGGESTGTTDETINVFIEAAAFDHVRTAATGRKLGVFSDARYRFERGVDAASVLPGLDQATQMVIELCGGEASEVTFAGDKPCEDIKIIYRYARYKSLTGVDITVEKTHEILENLGCSFEKIDDQSISIKPPTARRDLRLEEDIIEDILRMDGYDKIPLTALSQTTVIPRPALSPMQRRTKNNRRYLANRNLIENVTYSFLSEDKARMFGAQNNALILDNPISEELSMMRPSLLPNLVGGVRKNIDRDIKSVTLFEVGPIYQDDTPEGQKMMAGGIRTGTLGRRDWLVKDRAFDFYDVKADIIGLLTTLGMNEKALQSKREAPTWYHPGRSITIMAGKALLGYVGELHPEVQKTYGIKQRLYGFEIFIENIPFYGKKKAKKALELSPYQAVMRDFAFVVDKEINAADLIKGVQGADRQLIDDVTIFDVYEGEKLEPGKKSIALSVRLQPMAQTLTDQDIEAVTKKIIHNVQKFTGASLRE
jgi:phenylalanyl-tRNA synthetase beta chain